MENVAEIATFVYKFATLCCENRHKHPEEHEDRREPVLGIRGADGAERRRREAWNCRAGGGLSRWTNEMPVDYRSGGAGPRSDRESMTGALLRVGNSLSAKLAEWRSAAAHCAAQAGSKPSERSFSGAKRA